jgi:filamentous hemagglutinin
VLPWSGWTAASRASTSRGGDIFITGTGLNATAQQILDLVSRSVRIDGQVNTAAGGSLGITTGLNQWNYLTRSIIGSTTGEDAAPALALDSTALGGMYSGRIRLIATEAGVGVRMLGTAAASVDDFQLTSAGKVEIRSTVSAGRDVQIATTQSGAQALGLIDAQVSAKRDVTVTATAGDAAFQGGALVAGSRLDVNVGSLSDSSTSAKLTDNNRRFGSTVTLASAGSASLGGVSWGAVNDLSVTAASLAVTGTAPTSIYAGTTLELTTAGDMALADAGVRATGDLSITAKSGTLSIGSGSGQGVQSVQGQLDITAGLGLSNAGTISADQAGLTVRAGNGISNSGAMYASTTLDIADASGKASQSLTNSGTLLADGALLVQATAFDNQATGAIQGTQGTTINATSLGNAGVLVLSPDAAHDGTVTVATLTNSTTGVIQSGRDATFNVAQTLSNDGLILAQRNLGVVASDAGQTLAISNTANGYLQAGASLSVAGTGGGTNVSFGTQAGVLYGASDLNLQLASLNNSGTIQSGSDLTLSTTGNLGNSGSIIAAEALALSASTLTSSGNTQAGLGTTVTASVFENSGLVNGSATAGYDTVLTVGTLTNKTSGTIQSAGDLTLTVTDALNNDGEFIADGAIDLRAGNAGTTLVVSNQANGYMGAGTQLTIAGTAGASNVNVSTQSGVLLAGTNIDLKLAGLNSSGVVQAGEAVTINSSGGVTNSGLVAAGTTVSITAAGTLTNSATGELQAADGYSLNAGTFANSGLVLGTSGSTGNLDITVSTLTNAAGGAIESTGNLTVHASGLISNSGSLYAANDVNLAGSASTSTGSVTTASGSEIVAGGALSLKAAGMSNAGVVQSSRAMTLDVTGGTLTNTGTLFGVANGDAGLRMDVTAAVLNNSGASALIQGNGLTALWTGQLDNSGDIYGGNASSTLFVTSSKLGNTATGVIQSARHLTVYQNNSGATNSLDNSGAIVAAGDLRITDNGSGALASIRNASTGVIQAGNTLTFEGSKLDFGTGGNGQLGTALGNDVVIKALQFGTASGSTTQAGNDLNVTVTNGLSNGGVMLAGGATTLVAGAAANTGAIQSAKGLNLTATIFENFGDVIGSTDSKYDANITLRTLTNAAGGNVQSARDLLLNVRDTVINSGNLLANRDLKLAPSDPDGDLTLTNNATGLMQAVGTLSTGPSAGKTNFTLGSQAGTLAAGVVSLGVSSLTNSGLVQSDTSLSLSLSGDLNNTGALVSGGTLNLGAANVNNTGAGSLIQAADGMTLNATGKLTNAGAIVGSTTSFAQLDGGGTSIYAKTLTNQTGGVIQAVNNLGFGITDTLDNSGTISGERAVGIGGTGAATTLALTNQASGYIGASTGLANVVIGDGTNPVSVTNEGVIVSAQKWTLNSGSPVLNKGVMAGGSMLFTAPLLTNAASGTIQNTGTYKFTLGTLANSGAMVLGGGQFADNSWSSINADTLTNAAGAVIDSSTYAEMYVKDKLDNSGLISSASRLYC